MSAAGFVAILFIALLVCFCLKKWKELKEKVPDTPCDWSRVELPAFARTRDEDKTLRKQLASLLHKRPDLDPAFAQGAPVDGVHALAAGERWIRAVCRQNNVYAAALTAALCRLCPRGLPNDEADFWQGSLLSLLGEGEGHFLLGLSCLRLYETFRASDGAVAPDAWRQAVEHFRRSAATGHEDGMKAAYLLALIGHDVPFTPPAALPEPLPVDGDDEDRDPEVLYWRYRLAESGDMIAHVLGMQYLLQETPDVARAERWLRQAMACGDYMAALRLFENYHSGIFQDEGGRNAAICLICCICQQGLLQLGRPLTPDEVKEVAAGTPLDDDVPSLLAAHWDEGMAFHKSLWEAEQARYVAAGERLERCYAQAGEKLAALSGQAEERLRRWAAAGHADAAPRSKTPQAGPEKRRPAAARKNAPRRSFARPDKR